MMKISSPSRKIKTPSMRPPFLVLAAWFAACVAAAGCASMVADGVAEAPFALRPDTVEPGDLRGPFDGRVLDASTGRPIAGALVYASWGFEIGRGLVAPAGAVTATAESGSDGSYQVRALDTWPGQRTRAVSFTLIIYKPGYVAYRSDRRFDDLAPRRDFVQHANVARLERQPVGISHVRHVRFVGGGGALRRALAGEAVQASLELAAPARAEAAPPVGEAALDAGPLLSEDELRAVTGYRGTFVVERLSDLPQSSSYDSKHFRAEGKPESFDAALRVWRVEPAAAAARYATLEKEVPHAEPRDEAGDHSLRGRDGRILAAAALERERGLVVELTCGVDLCRDAEQVVALMRRVLARAERIGRAAEPAPSPPPPEEAPPTKEPEPEEQPFRLRPPALHR
jgi:hypothetical protein